MDTISFLRKILPSRGNYFVATLQQGKERPWFRHFHCETREEAAARAVALDSSCENVYYACSSYREPFIMVKNKQGEEKKRERVQDNVLLVRSFWIDLDVKNEPTAYASQQEAIVGLGEFLRASRLPVPLIVSSGNGLHCYWPLTEDISPPQWVAAARLLKNLASHLGLKQDPSRTSDYASVLRPIGTYNRKDPQAPKLVELVRDAEPISFVQFYGALETACRSEGVDTPKTTAASPASDVNAKFLAPSDYPDSHASLIADRCPQIRAMRDTGGNVPEPVWYGAIQVLRCTVEGRDVIHAWSSGYSGYSPEETDKKIAQVEGMGPLTCEKFEERNPAGCVGCPYKGRVVSPIMLGIQRKSLEAPVVTVHTDEGVVTVQTTNPPAPYLRTKDGVFVEIEAGAQQKILGYDFYLSEIIDDEHMETHQVTAHVKKPMDPPVSFPMPMNVVSSPAKLEEFLCSRSILPDNTKLMKGYVSSYIKSIQNQVATKKLLQSMGWKEDKSAFVVGRKVFQADGSVVENAVGSKVKAAAEGFGTKGDVNVWAQHTEVLGQPGLEAHAFTLLLGFGAPLLTFTGHHGVVFSAVGVSGAGKTTLGSWLLSIWGNPDRIRTGVNDTKLSQFERIGIFRNLPVYIDETTSISAEDKSALAYQISRGEGRRRLNKDGTEKAPMDWSTFLITTTNSSWQSALGGAKQDSQPEQVRVFEYEMPRFETMGATWKMISDALQENYGTAGEIFIRYLVQNTAGLREQIRKIEGVITKLGNCESHERFWVSGAACAILAGFIARQIGILRFDIAPLIHWVAQQIKLMRIKVNDSRPDEVTLLSSYLNEFSDNRVVINKFEQGMRQTDPVKRPSGELLHHYELDRGVMWINRKHIVRELGKRRQNEDRFLKELLKRGIVTNPHIKFTLGRGTPYASGQVWCWQINMKHEAFMDFQEGTNGSINT